MFEIYHLANGDTLVTLYLGQSLKFRKKASEKFFIFRQHMSKGSIAINLMAAQRSSALLSSKKYSKC